MRRWVVAILGMILLAAASTSSRSAPAQAPNGYTVGFDGCFHRLPWAVLQGYPKKPCAAPVPQNNNSKLPPVVFSTATPSQVLAALECDFAAAAQATKGKKMDFSRALITGSLTFSLVTKNSVGVSLTIGAIPVFPSTTLAPSLDASRLTETTQSNAYSITIDPGALTPCASSSTNNWLTSQVILDIAGINVDKWTTEVDFVVTKQGSAGLKLNIVPVAIGPQGSHSEVNTQKLMLVFDYTKKAGAPAAAAGKPAQ
jgi:hypothetical protein